MIELNLIQQELNSLPPEEKRRVILSLSPQELQALYDLLPAPIPDLCITSSPKQKAFIEDTAKCKIALCARRSGKSYAAAIILIQTALLNPGSTSVYITKTIEVAYRILIKDIVEVLNKKFNLNLIIYRNPGRIIFPNKSIIYLIGVDNSEDERTKLLGQRYACCVIDEVQDFSIDVYDLINRIIKPALLDLNGTLCLIGTASDKTYSYFYDLTKDYLSIPPFSFHTWTAKDNYSIPEGQQKPISELILTDIEEMKSYNPNIESTPYFQQHYLARWCVNTSALVYRPSSINFINTLPNAEYTYLLSIDLGFSDSSAFVVGAYSKYDKRLYIIESYKLSKMDFTDVANKIKEYQQRYTFFRIIIDAANLQGVQEIRRRHQINLVPAIKNDKVLHISLFNADLDAGNILILPKAAEGLKKEYQFLIWSDKKKDTEDPKAENHLSDATLYLWRHARNYLAKPPLPRLTEQQLFDKECDDRIRQSQRTFDEDF